MKRSGFVLLLIFYYFFSSNAQSLKPAPLGGNVKGHQLTQKQRVRYSFFSEYDKVGFISASFYHYLPRTILCVIHYDSYRLDSVYISTDSLTRLTSRIENADAWRKLKIEKAAHMKRLVCLKNGDRFYALVHPKGIDSIQFEKSGKEYVTVEARQIRKLKNTRVTRDREKLLNHRSDPNYTRMIFSNNSLMLKKKELLVSDYNIIAKGVNYGVTKNLNVNIGATLAPGVKINEQLAFASVRTGVSIGPAIHVSAGICGMYAGGGISMGYVSMSLGDRDLSFTCGAGSAFFHEPGGGMLPLPPVFMLGANARLSNRFALVTDNLMVYNNFGGIRFYSAALRMFGNQFSADAGIGSFFLFNSIGRNEESLPIPILSVTYCFSCLRKPEKK